jgi:endonuclease/exonuclease/phosphatase family metal-dependent hydrolase
MNRLSLRLLVRPIVALSMMLLLTPVSLATQGVGSDRPLKVLTRNMYVGTDFGPILTATSFDQFVQEVAEAYVNVQVSNIPERAAALAKEIEVSHPQLIGLQEVGVWRTGPLFGPANNVTYDALQSLLDALESRGLHYYPVAVLKEFEAEAPSALGIQIGFTDRDVILARSDLDSSELKLSNVQAQHFQLNLPFTSPILGTLVIPRGWLAIDGKFRGKPFRFINTHLESFHLGIQAAQSAELMDGPANTDLPVVIVGDLNTESPTGDPNQNLGYQIIAGAGFADAWIISHPNDSGFTWALHGDDPFTPTVPTQRLDLVFVRGHLAIFETTLIGNTLGDVTPSGLWPSDHAGVLSVINLKL